MKCLHKTNRSDDRKQLLFQNQIINQNPNNYKEQTRVEHNLKFFHIFFYKKQIQCITNKKHSQSYRNKNIPHGLIFIIMMMQHL